MKDEIRLYFTYDERESGGEPMGEGPYCSHEPSHLSVKFHSFYKDPPKHRFFYDSVVIYDFKLLDKEYLYLAVIRYTTGSTFGTSYGRWCIAGVSDSYSGAEKVVKNALANGINKLYPGYKPWDGYFERLEGSEIHKLELNK